MSVDKKSHSWARELQNKLSILAATFATPLATYGDVDTNGNPLVGVGVANPPVAGGTGALIRIKPIDWPLTQTSVGLPQPVYNPHLVEVIYEAGIAGNTVEVLDNIKKACFELGANVAIYVTTNGTAPTYANMTSTYLKATIRASLQYGMVGSL